MNSLEKTWNMLFTPFAQLFSSLPLKFLQIIFLPVWFLHLSLLEHPTTRQNSLKEKLWQKKTDWLLEITAKEMRLWQDLGVGLLTFGLGAGGCLWEAGEASGPGWVHLAPWRMWRSRSTARHPSAEDLQGDTSLWGELLHKRDAWIYAD